MGGCLASSYSAAVLVGATALFGCSPRFPQPGEPVAAANAIPVRTAYASTAPRPAYRRELPDFAALVASCGPSVVNVTVVKQSGDDGDHEQRNPIREFLRRFGMDDPDAALALARGQASGFIVSEDGYIITSAHVARAATIVTVKLTDRREFPARVVGADSVSDIAVLKIDATRLPVVRFGDPSRVEPGQWVVAIGSPFGFENSVTVGVVSGIARALPDSDYSSFIQTDVALNPGNSGGPLFNLDGEVIGINSQIISRNGGYMGMSFATPIDVVREIEKQLIASGRIVRGRLGVATQEVNAQLAESFGLDRARGALVSAVEHGSPAEKYGIKAGDVILQIDRVPIERSGQVPRIIASLRPGTTTHLTVWRGRSSREIAAVVDEVSDEGPAQTPPISKRDEPIASVGLAVRALTPEERKAFETTGSLMVTRTSGAAALAGIEEGDLLLAVNGTSVESAREVRTTVAEGGNVVAFLIQRDGEQLFVPVPLTPGANTRGAGGDAAAGNQAAD